VFRRGKLIIDSLGGYGRGGGAVGHFGCCAAVWGVVAFTRYCFTSRPLLHNNIFCKHLLYCAVYCTI